MSTFNDIGISRQLDWNRIRKLFIIGLFGGIMTLIGDWLLGYGVYDESLTGLERKLSQYLALSDGKIFWSAFLGLIGISLEGLCYFGVYRLIENDTYAHIFRSGVFGYMLFAACGVHVPCLSTVFFYKHMMLESPDHAYDLTVKFGLYFLLPALILFLVFFIIMSAAQISAFAKGLTPYPKWCWIFSMPVAMTVTMLLKFTGNHAIANGLTAAWISIGNIWMFGGLLLTMRLAKKGERIAMKQNESVKVVAAPNALQNPLYQLVKKAVKAANLRKSLVGTKEEVLAKAAKMNAKNRHFIMPTDNKAHYTDHLIQGQYHCVEINIEKARRKRAILFVFGGGMILGSDQGDVGLSRKIAERTDADVWFPYYPLCHEHDLLENVQMIYECYVKMLQFYKPENIVFLGFSSGGALMLDLITYLNELNDSGSNMPMPGLLIPISPGSVPVNQKERAYLQKLDSRDIMIPASYMGLAKEIMCCGHDVPEKYLATAHGDFRNAPMTHFYYGSAETLYAFAPSYAESYRKAGAKCMIHVGKGMHHCYAMQYFIPGCKPAFDEVMRLIQNYFKKERAQ